MASRPKGRIGVGRMRTRFGTGLPCQQQSRTHESRIPGMPTTSDRNPIDIRHQLRVSAALAYIGI